MGKLRIVTVGVVTISVIAGSVLALPYVLNTFYNGATVLNHILPAKVDAGSPVRLELRIRSFGPRELFFWARPKYAAFTCIYRYSGETGWRQRPMRRMSQTGGYDVAAAVELPPLPAAEHENLEYYFSYTKDGHVETVGSINGGAVVVPIANSK